MRRYAALVIVVLLSSSMIAAVEVRGDEPRVHKAAEPRGDADKNFFDTYSGGLLILIMFCILVVTLIILVPQLLRAHLRKAEMTHLENLKALESGLTPQLGDERARVAGRAAMLVPMVVVIAAGTVTCFLVAYRAESLFTVTLAVWVVAGVVSLAAITGGGALIARLAQLQAEEEDEDNPPRNPLE
jgi:hypothetical protein